MTLISGTRVGPYEVLSPAGAGGMGEVYRVRDTRLNRDYARRASERSSTSVWPSSSDTKARLHPMRHSPSSRIGRLSYRTNRSDRVRPFVSRTLAGLAATVPADLPLPSA